MTIKRKLLNKAIGILSVFFGKDNINKFLSNLSEKLIPVISKKTDFGEVYFYGLGLLAEFRARTLLEQEPDTIKWIDSFDNSDLLWDIGANVGIYSIYAALKGHRVLAFEPQSANYFLLNKNIEINDMDDKISAYCLAFNSDNNLDFFNLQRTWPGASLNVFAKTIDAKNRHFEPEFKQAMIGYSIDHFVEYFDPPFPNHIKIDVDGNEHDIISGARKTLLDERIKSVSIEINTDLESNNEIRLLLEKSGFELFQKEQRGKHLPNSLFLRKANVSV